ncbi:MAG: hypothetical protein ACI9ZH_002186 [Paracoccaceae bacterium]|jgi:hypothetical protein
MSIIRNGLCAAIFSLGATASQALPVTIDFEVDLYSDISAYDAAPGYGTLVYEDGFVFGTTGDVTLTPLAGLISFSMTLFTGKTYEQTFTAADDSEYDAFPEVYFYDQELYGIDFFVDGLATSMLAPGVEMVLASYDCGCFGEFFLSTGLGDPNRLTVFAGTADVPVPAALPLMLGGIAAFGLIARRRKG